ncbi:MAG: UDP-N-acetylglucosamine 2-epimerase (non-hydrolyzing) [bacterium]
MKIVTIVGARPQFIKAAPVSHELRKDHTEVLVHTGQHYDDEMSKVFFDELKLNEPDYHLGVGSGTHAFQTGEMLKRVEEVLIKEKPDYVIVYGDTNSTLAGALAAKKLHITLVHVEAGLRSYNMQMPEEINRILTDRISDILCCPTDKAVENLKKEGFDILPCKVVKTGDVMYDASLFYRQFSKKPHIANLQKNGFILATVHRAENTDNKFRLLNIFEAFEEIAKKGMPIVLPLHPRTRNIINSSSYALDSAIHIIEPVSYLEMIWLLEHCQLVMTDSGGLQKEAFFFQKPCITLRDETEWVELVEHSVNLVSGADKNRILDSYNFLNLHNPLPFAFCNDLYGDGQSGKRIVDELIERWKRVS